MEIPSEVKPVLRRLWRSPMFTVVTLATLAIGIGANTAMFSVVNGVLLKPLPFPRSEELVGVWQTAHGLGLRDVNASPSTYFAYREESQTFQDIGLWQFQTRTITGISDPEQVESLGVTDGLLPLLGIQPVLGRWFRKEDDLPNRPETVMLGYAYWQRRFGGERSVLGRKLLVDGRPREIIGVMPESFRLLWTRPSVLTPFQFNRSEVFLGNFSYQAIARLKPEVGIAQANADVARIIPMLPDKFKSPNGMTAKMFEEARLAPNLRPLKDDAIGDVGRVLWVLMATVGIVLFIACANAANLMLVRAESRQQELAVRAALGAGWSRLAREILLETVALGLIGGIAGVGLAFAGLRLLVYLAPARLPRLDEISIDPIVLAFAFGLSVAAGLLFGLAPVFKYARPRITAALRVGGRTFSDGRERHRTQKALVVVQVALALVLLIGAGLMIRTFQSLRRVQPGFTDPEQVFTLRISIPVSQVKEPERVARMQYDIVQKFAAIRGVVSVGMANGITMDGTSNNDPIWVQDRAMPEEKIPPIRRYKHIAPGFFRTMGNSILFGRDVTWTDIFEKRPVVLLSENLARELWGDPAQAIGKRVRENPKGTWREVIGVVAPERDNGVDKPAPAIVYWPMLKTDFWGQPVDVRRTMAFALRTERAGSESLLQEVRAAAASVNPDLPLASIRTLREIHDRSMARTSFTLVMLGIASSMALLLGIVGIYGVISYSITQRTREIGIRIALGAPQAAVRRMFIGQGLTMAAIGVVCGVAAAVPLTRLMSALLFEVSPIDAITYCAVSAGLIAAAVTAAYLPARRATRIEPVQALRAD